MVKGEPQRQSDAGRYWHAFSSRGSGYQALYKTLGEPVDDDQIGLCLVAIPRPQSKLFRIPADTKTFFV